MNWWEYLILVNVYLVLFFSFYALLLKRETFFQLNRVYLVSAALLSFLMPMIQSGWVKDMFITQTVHAEIYGSPVIAYQYKAVADTPMTIGELLAIVYLAGVGLLVLRFAWQLISLRRIINRPDAAAPYTFFKKVQVDSALSENEIIAAHEQVHASQLHSFDVMIIEAVMIVNWFNPVVYFYRFAIKHIHEFIADSYTLRNGTDKADYAMLLLSQTFNAPQHQLVSNFFNRSLLKQRIMMLQKNRSTRIKLVKYGLSAPLFALMLILSAATVNTSNAVNKVNVFASNVFNTPANKITTIRLMPPPDTSAADSSMIKQGTVIDRKIDSPVMNGLSTVGKVSNLQVTRSNDTVPGRDAVFSAVEKEPQFAGSFGTFLGKNIHYPAVDKDHNVQGKVFIQFIVEKDGSLSNIEVLRAPSETLGNEAARVIGISPKWIPGYQNGKAVRVSYTVPISFTLAPADDNKSSAAATSTFAGQTLTSVDKVPQFPGSFGEFLAKNIHYPAVDKDNNVQGRVFVQFIVEKDGSLTDFKVLRSPSQSLSDEAIRVLNLSPKWIPGYQNGKTVRVAYTVPITFSLSPDDDKGSLMLNPVEVVGYGKPDSNKNLANGKVFILTTPSAKEALIVVDGKQKTYEDFKAMDVNTIQSINVYKSDAAQKLYGDKGKNGAIIVTTKK